MILLMTKAPKIIPKMNTANCCQLPEMSLSMPTIGSQRPIINNINEPEIPGRNIAPIAKNPPTNKYPVLTEIEAGFKNTNATPITNPAKQ